MKTVGSL